MTQKYEKVINSVLGKITETPGIHALANINPNKSNAPLNESDWEKSFLIMELKDSLDVSFAFIKDESANAKEIAKELNALIETVFKKEKIKLSKINLYLRGVK